jgi:hypothetical protein
MFFVTLAFLALVVLVPIIALTLISVGAPNTAETFATATAPLSALAAGLLGLLAFAKEDFGLEDRFNSMNLLLALGLVVLTLAEIGTAIISSMPSGRDFYFTISLLVIPGILLWGIGVTRYLVVCWRTINGENPKEVLLAVALIAGSITALTQILGAFIAPDRSLIDVTVCIPVGFGILMIAGILTVLLWIFRRGMLALPIGFSLMAAILFCVQYYSWCVLRIDPTSMISRLIAIEIYILMGASVSIAGRLDAAT